MTNGSRTGRLVALAGALLAGLGAAGVRGAPPVAATSGRVVDERTGAPIANATIGVAESVDDLWNDGLCVSLQKTRELARSDAKGDFALDGATTPFTIALRRPARVAAEVVDADGAAVAGVELRLSVRAAFRGRFSDRSPARLFGVRVEASARTGPDGHAQVDALPADAEFEVDWREGDALLARDDTPVAALAGATAKRRLALPPGLALCGRVVVDRAGTLLAMARVACDELVRYTDERGRFVWPVAVAPLRKLVVSDALGREPARFAVREVVLPADGAPHSRFVAIALADATAPR